MDFLLKRTNISRCNLFLTHLICCSIKIFKKFPICSICYENTVKKILLSVHKNSSPRSFPPRIWGTDKQLNDKTWKCGVGNEFTLQIYSHLFLHVHFTQHDTASRSVCVIYVNQHQFKAVLSDHACFTLISIPEVHCVQNFYFLCSLQIA